MSAHEIDQARIKLQGALDACQQEDRVEAAGWIERALEALDEADNSPDAAAGHHYHAGLPDEGIRS